MSTLAAARTAADSYVETLTAELEAQRERGKADAADISSLREQSEQSAQATGALRKGQTELEQQVKAITAENNLAEQEIARLTTLLEESKKDKEAMAATQTQLVDRVRDLDVQVRAWTR